MPTVVRWANGTAVLYPERLFDANAPVGRWSKTVSQELLGNTQREAPSRTGALRAGLSVSELRSGPTSRTMTLRSSAAYTKYVIGGTDGGYMDSVRALPPWGRFTRTTVIKAGRWLNGQDANDFIGRGISATSIRHEALRGWRSVWPSAPTDD